MLPGEIGQDLRRRVRRCVVHEHEFEGEFTGTKNGAYPRVECTQRVRIAKDRHDDTERWAEGGGAAGHRAKSLFDRRTKHLDRPPLPIGQGLTDPVDPVHSALRHIYCDTQPWRTFGLHAGRKKKSLSDPFIINVCLAGMLPTRAMNAAIPLTPSEIARDVEACIEFGASMFHVHARDANEAPEWRTEAYSAIMRAIREVSSDVVVCVTTSGRDVTDVAQRGASLLAEPKPDMGSLTMGSINFMRDATRNSPESIRGLVEAMDARDVKPELEIFDIGMARTTARLIREGVLRAPHYANVLLGNVASADATPLDLAALTAHLPEGTIWCAGGVGKSQLTANALGILFGDGVRVGLEDNLYMDAEKTLATNPGLVRRVVELGRLLGKRPSTIAETRERLAL